MNNNDRPWPRATLPLVRCAVYTRKSTEEGLEQEFNSLDAQREAGEAYIRSPAGQGWALLPDRYDDGGVSGGNMRGAARKRCSAVTRPSTSDCFGVYRGDPLSHPRPDLAGPMETFE